MDAQKVDMYLVANSKYFEGHQLHAIREKLLTIDDARFAMILTISLKNPDTYVIISLFSGMMGIDRFMIGDVGLGVGKLLTCGGFYIWAIVDWFSIASRAKEINFQKIMSAF